MNLFLENEIDGDLLITNRIDYFNLVLQQIKADSGNKKILIKFELVIFGDEETKNIIKIIMENDYRKYFNSILVISCNSDLYINELKDEIITKIISHRHELISFLKSNECFGSLRNLKIHKVITIYKYDKKYYNLHETIAKYYRKISEDYSKTALNIFKDFLFATKKEKQLF